MKDWRLFSLLNEIMLPYPKTQNYPGPSLLYVNKLKTFKLFTYK